MLKGAFGETNFFENFKLVSGSDKVVGEIDILIAHGEFAIVVQAKSKRMTLKARAGDKDAFKTDFEDAIRAPYGQALDCIRHIKAGAKCINKHGNEPHLHGLPRFFPLVVLSDFFPAITYLTSAMLEKPDEMAPAVCVLGVLDCITRICLVRSTRLLILNAELTVLITFSQTANAKSLCYHLSSKLALSPDVDGLYLERDLATVVDDFMISSDMRLNVERPVGILER